MNSKITPVLTVLLVIVSFLAGSMYTRVKMMEKDQADPGQAAQVTVAPQQQAPEAIVLGAEDRAEIEGNGAAVKGPEDAKVTIVEFSEYECPFCQRYVQETYPQIISEYGNDLRYVFHDYPLEFHQHANTMANAARCAGAQDKYWEMHDEIFNGRDEWAEETDVSTTLSSYATKLGLDVTSFDQCVANNEYAGKVEADLALAQKVGVSGTPTFYINGKQLVGAQPFEAFKAIIEEELAK